MALGFNKEMAPSIGYWTAQYKFWGHQDDFKEKKPKVTSLQKIYTYKKEDLRQLNIEHENEKIFS